MKYGIRNVLSKMIMFIMAGVISFAFNSLLGGNTPIMHSFLCGMFIVIIYDLFTYLLIETKSDLRTPAKVFLSSIFAFCVFVTMGCTTASSAKNIRIFWWMYLIWALFAVFAACKSYRDAKKI